MDVRVIPHWIDGRRDEGSPERMGDVYDPATGRITPRRVVGWYDNGKADHFLQVEVEGGPSGRRRFAATPNHLIFTPRGEVPAGSLRVGDEVLVVVEDFRLTEDQFQLVVGGALGDGSLRKVGAHAATFRVGHGEEQEAYARWKHWMLEPFSRAFGRVGQGKGFDTMAFPALADLHAALYAPEGRRTATQAVLDRLDARGLAVWYGDDGSFGGHFDRWGHGKAVLYNKTLRGEARERALHLFERLGVGRPRDDGRGFWFSAEQTARLHALIAPYLHPSVEYKLHPALRGRFAWQPDLSDAHLNGTRLAARRLLRAVPARVTKIYVKPPTRTRRRFDLQVEGNHTYLVDGVVVHNSPETTTGGRALKFYSSVRMEIRRTENIKSGEEVKGMRARVKVVKNKVAPPFRDAEVDIFYGQGISRAGSVLDVAQAVGVVTRTGTWFAYGDLRLGQGRDNARDFLENNPELMREIEQRVREKLGLPRRPAAGGPGEVAATGAPPVPAASPGPVAIPSRARGAEPVASAKEAAAKARG